MSMINIRDGNSPQMICVCKILRCYGALNATNFKTTLNQLEKLKMNK